jgi:hypothetical protein
MMADLTRYELRVSTLLSRAALAAFHVPVTPTAIPRNTVYRFRIPADRDPTEVLHRLTEFDVQVLEIRRCSVASRRDRGPEQPGSGGPPPETGESAAATAGVLLPFPLQPRGSDPDGDGSTR